MFISFEGIDKVGKSTQANILKNYLEKNLDRIKKSGVVVIDFADDKIVQTLKNEIDDRDELSETLIFLGVLYSYKKKIEEYIGNNFVVITTRWLPSTYAYQIRKLQKPYKKYIKDLITNLFDIHPDLVIYLYRKEELLYNGDKFEARLNKEMKSILNHYRFYLTYFINKKIKVTSIKETSQKIIEAVESVIKMYKQEEAE